MDPSIYTGKYYVFEISSAGATGVFAYDTYNAAVAAFHSNIASKMADASLTWATVGVMNEYGTISKVERYEKHTEG